jgi:hypothetical protein
MGGAPSMALPVNRNSPFKVPFYLFTIARNSYRYRRRAVLERVRGGTQGVPSQASAKIRGFFKSYGALKEKSSVRNRSS